MDTYTHGHAEPVLQSHRWRTVENSAAYLLPSLRPGLDLLDVGCGPGTITVDLAARVAPGWVVGLDLSPEPLAEARAAAERAGVDVSFQVGDVYALEAPDDSFDVVHAHQVLQHLTDPIAALREMARVCRPGGRVAILELGEPRRGVIAPLARFHIRHVVPRVGALLSGAREYRYLQSSIAAFPAPDAFAAMMTEAGLAVLEVVPLTFGVCTLFVGTPAREAS